MSVGRREVNEPPKLRASEAEGRKEWREKKWMASRKKKGKKKRERNGVSRRSERRPRLDHEKVKEKDGEGSFFFLWAGRSRWRKKKEMVK